MAHTVSVNRRPAATRRFGYATAAVVYAALLCTINIWPRWQALPFLAEDTSEVIGLVNLWLVAGMASHADYLAYGTPWTRSLGDLVTTGIGLAALIRVWQVFPFTFGGPVSSAVRVALAVAIVGSAVGAVACLMALVRRRGTGGGARAGHGNIRS
jgi:hypothetical protein